MSSRQLTLANKCIAAIVILSTTFFLIPKIAIEINTGSGVTIGYIYTYVAPLFFCCIIMTIPAFSTFIKYRPNWTKSQLYKILRITTIILFSSVFGLAFFFSLLALHNFILVGVSLLLFLIGYWTYEKSNEKSDKKLLSELTWNYLALIAQIFSVSFYFENF